MALGVGGLVVATLESRRALQEFRANFADYGPFRRSPAFLLETAVSGLGVIGFVLVFLRL